LAGRDRAGLNGLTPEEGRRFGLLVGGAFLALTALLAWRSRSGAAAVTGTLGLALVLAGILVPGRLGPVYRGWMRLATVISRVTTPIFMGIVYFVIMWPLGWARRLFGKNPMVHEAADGSYWKTRSGEPGDMRRQF